MKKMTPEELREYLASKRDQKFRSQTESRLDCTEALIQNNKLKAKDPVEEKKRIAALRKATQSEEWLSKNKKQLEALFNDKAFSDYRNKRNREVNGKEIVTPYGRYETISDFKNEHGINFFDKMRFTPNLYYYLDEGPKTKIEKVYYANGYCHNTSRKLYEVLQVKSTATDRPWIRWFKKMMKEYPDQYYVKEEPKREWELCDEFGNPNYKYDYEKGKNK